MSIVKALACCLFILAGCQKKQEPYVVSKEIRGGSEVWTYHAPNGVTLITTANHVDLVLGTNQGFSFRWNATNQSVSNLVLEISMNGESRGQWVTDGNFDGVPDTRRLKGGGREVFYAGSWYPSIPLGGSVSVELSGKTVELVFDGSKWIRKE
jgi:hypothetical protein